MNKYFYGIGKKFWIYTSLLLVISAMLTISGILFVITTSEKSRTEELYINKTEYMFDMFDSAYENLDMLTSDLITNDYIQKSLTDKQLSSYDHKMINRTLFYLSSDYISYYYYFDNQDNLYTQKKMNLKKSDIMHSNIEESMRNSYARTTLMFLDTSVLGNAGKHFVIGRYMHHLTQNKNPGIVLLILKKSFFFDAVGKAKDTQANFFIANESGEICQRLGKKTPSQNPIEKHLKKYIEENEIRDNCFVLQFSEGMLCGKRHEPSGFFLLTFVPRAVQKQMQNKLVSIVIFVAIGVLFVAAWVAGYFSRHLAKPIQKISANMTNFNMDSLTSPLFINTNTELDNISQSYNMMLEQIDALLAKVKSQQEKLKNTEIEALMYQIHPHFLYNTLGNIYMLARLNGEETMMQMVDSLSRFLRITLNNGDEDITIQEEIEHVCAYMEILRIRNSDAFHYEIDFDEDAKNRIIIKLILQPLAENAIKHGFAKYDEGGLIRISVKKEQNLLHFRIYDNGVGIDTETLKKINRLDEEILRENPDKEPHKGIGIRNVIYRLKLKYGADAHFWYESVTGNTTGHITIELH